MRWLFACCLACCAAPPPPPPAAPAPPPIRPVPFEIAASRLTTGDSIEVTTLEGDHDGCVAGATYTISGHYLLSSRSDAELVISEQNGKASEGENVVHRGSGDFSFTLKKLSDGPFEVAMLRVGGGSSMGSIVVRCGGPPK
jgi:hypothetical protein